MPQAAGTSVPVKITIYTNLNTTFLDEHRQVDRRLHNSHVVNRTTMSLAVRLVGEDLWDVLLGSDVKLAAIPSGSQEPYFFLEYLGGHASRFQCLNACNELDTCRHNKKT